MKKYTRLTLKMAFLAQFLNSITNTEAYKRQYQNRKGNSMLYGLANYILSSDTVIDKTFMCKTQNLIRRKKKKKIKMTLLSSFLFQFIAKDRPYMESNTTFRVHQVIGITCT